MTWKGGLIKNLVVFSFRLKESKMFCLWTHSCCRSNIRAVPTNLSQGLLCFHTHIHVNSHYASCHVNDTVLLWSKLARSLVFHLLLRNFCLQNIQLLEHSLRILLSIPLYTFTLSQFGKEVINVKSPISSVSTVAESVRPNYTLVAPAPQGVGMDVKNTSYFAYSQKRRYFIVFTHSFIPIYLKTYLAIGEVLPFIKF